MRRGVAAKNVNSVRQGFGFKDLLRSLSLFAVLSVAGASFAVDHLDLGSPGKADKEVKRTGYALGYSEKYEQALWAQYRLTREQVTKKNTVRSNDFKDDPDIPTGSAKAKDYSKSGYDKGHLVPAEDMRYSDVTMRESFYMSNMSPQSSGFNRGIWKRLEKAVRRFAFAEGSIVVVTGPIFDKYGGRTIGDGVAVPTAFYKVIYDETPPCKMIAFLLPHESSQKGIKDFVCTVSKVEERTGLKFFPKLSSGVSSDLKTRSSPSEWSWK